MTVLATHARAHCCNRVLCSNGWVQMTEWELVFRSDNGNVENLQALRRWTEVYLTAVSSGNGVGRKSRTIPENLETMMRTSGFLNVSTDIREVPTCGWPRGVFRSKEHPGRIYC